MAARRACLAALMLLALAGCMGEQSALNAHGAEARSLARLFWLFTAVMAAIWLATMAALVMALRARRRPGADPLRNDPRRERGIAAVVIGCVALTALTIVALTALSYAAQRSLFVHKDGVVTIRLTGHQWWWEATYEDPQASLSFTTANEIHVPVGESVLIKLESSDVIHSFWVPSLAGKLDLIPGRQNAIEIRAERPGTYRGQCAEFCGLQHAHMSMLVIAQPREAFDRWRETQRAAAQPPQDRDRQRGMEVFVSRPCAQCHTVRGTTANGRVGPDLTHLGSRQTLAAGTLPLTRGNLAAWMVDPQHIKPGANMPVVKLTADEVEPLARYLEGLK